MMVRHTIRMFRRDARRVMSVAAMTFCALAATGCHHQANVSYHHAPPPLPADDSGTPSSAARRAPRIQPMAPETIPSTSLDSTLGKPVFVEYGTASWYGPPYHHHNAADGSVFDQDALTAAHRELPMGSTVRVTNVATGQSVVVRITDRGPFVPGRVLDLSLGAAKAIGTWRAGVAKVKIEAFAHPTNDPAGRWCVQIGAFHDEEDSLDLKTMLQDRYKTAKVIEFTGPTGHWVRINPAVPDHSHANEIARWVNSPDPAALPYVVRTD